MRRKKDKSNGITALYERLSRDDDNAGESNSMDELERMAFIIRSTMTAVLTLPTANTLTKNEPNKISIGTVTMASAISKIPIRKMSCLPLLKMWNSFFIVSGIVIL